MRLSQCRVSIKSWGGRVVIAALAVTLGLVVSPAAHAQIARVAAVEHVTEKRAGTVGAWRAAAVGTALQLEDRFRTGKRSKADIKFTDGSLLRLGQLSSVEMRGTKSVALTGGQLLFVALRPGRVLAGSATGEIKGSTGIITLNGDGSSTFALYSGAMDVVAPTSTISLKPGQELTVLHDGTLEAIRATAPFNFANGSGESELSNAPSNSPSVGSRTMTRERMEPFHSVAAESAALLNSKTTPLRQPIVPMTAPVTPSNPFPTPFPVIPPGLSHAQPDKSFSTPPVLRHDVATANNGVGTPTTPDTAGLDTSAAAAHMGDMNTGLGSGDSGDARLIGVIGNGGTYAYGGRLYASGSQGHWSTEIEFTPLRVHTRERGTFDLSTFSGGDITYRLKRTIIKAGRQKFLDGPTQAALLGSMVRQGGREVMDAFSITQIMGKGRLQVAYLYDAFPKNLPFNVPGAQHGWYGRYSLQQPYGNFGLNVLNYQKAPIRSGTGVTADFALPVIRNQVEFYGELGRDPFKRRLTTFGLTLPGLYDRTDLDVYLEYAKLSGSSQAAGLPPELALLIYRRVSSNVNLLLSVDHFSGLATRVSLGLSAGMPLGPRSEY